jgi:hypothetical protein
MRNTWANFERAACAEQMSFIAEGWASKRLHTAIRYIRVFCRSSSSGTTCAMERNSLIVTSVLAQLDSDAGATDQLGSDGRSLDRLTEIVS